MSIRVIAGKPTCKAVSIISEGLPRDRKITELAYRWYHGTRINGNTQRFRHWNEPWKIRDCGGHVRSRIITFDVRSSRK